MRVAFEGPDKAGKSTIAEAMAWTTGDTYYNISKKVYDDLPKEDPDTVTTFDRIDWFSHLVYRMAMTGYEWHDAAVRTVFPMPDTHLVVRVHSGTTVGTISDELYPKGSLVKVNQAYTAMAHSVAWMNTAWNYQLFKSVSLMIVEHDMDTGAFNEFGAYVLSHHALSPYELSPMRGGVNSLEFLLQSLEQTP